MSIIRYGAGGQVYIGSAVPISPVDESGIPDIPEESIEEQEISLTDRDCVDPPLVKIDWSIHADSDR